MIDVVITATPARLSRGGRLLMVVLVGNLIRVASGRESGDTCDPMKDLCRLMWSVLRVLLRSRAALAAENLALRQQITVVLT